MKNKICEREEIEGGISGKGNKKQKKRRVRK
jgi:hypothetical protein